MATNAFEQHKIPLESWIIRLATKGLNKEGVDADALRVGMRRTVRAIVNQVPLGMMPGFSEALYQLLRAKKYGWRGLSIAPKIIGELYIYEDDDEALKAFKREFRWRILEAQLGVHDSVDWLLKLQKE